MEGIFPTTAKWPGGNFLFFEFFSPRFFLGGKHVL